MRYVAKNTDKWRGKQRMAAAWDETYDFVIIGSGAAAVCAALVMQRAGHSAVVLEKTELIGGSTAMSGGVFWAPNNSVMREAGVEDSYELARTYLDACVGDAGPASSPARRHAFLTFAPKMIDFLRAYGMKFKHAEGYSDYHEGERPGGVARGRSLVADIFDARELEEDAKRLRRGASPALLVNEVGALTLYGRSWKSRLTMLKVGLRMVRQKFGADLVGSGAAIQGRLLQIARREKIPILTNAPVLGLVEEAGRVAGVRTRKDGREVSVEARRGVLINAGGFSHNTAMRDQHLLQPNVNLSHANPGDTGELIQMAEALGADVDIMEQCWWVSTSKMPGGARGVHPFDMAKPHSIVVDGAGQRYLNESTSYMAVGIAMYERQKTVQAVPSWWIVDSGYMHAYTWYGRPPGDPPAEWITSGYMKKADTIEGLAEACGLNPAALRATVERFNGFAKTGVDQDFHRGDSAYGRFLGDPSNKPNPNLGPLDRAPYYAVKLYPGDVGTCGGLMTDEFARVLKADGSIIPGLYATGNSTASVMGRSYPGAGASIAASATFGFIAARHAASVND
jgi:3-oxosteroid 1-dehydrogenase